MLIILQQERNDILLQTPQPFHAPLDFIQDYLGELVPER